MHGFLRLLILPVIYLSFVSGCSNSDRPGAVPVGKSSFVVAVPQIILESNLPATCRETLSGSLSMDGERTEVLAFSGDKAIVTIANSTSGKHEFIIEFSCTSAEEPVVLARSTPVSQTTSIQDGSSLTDDPNFIQLELSDYLPLVDTDQDSVSNLRELELGENPLLLNPPKVPDISAISMGQSILFSAEINDEYTASYTLLAYPNRGSNYVTIVSGLPEAQVSVPYSGYEMLLTQYVLQACNSICTDSNKLDIQQDMLDQMAYIKAFDTQSGINFGNAVSVSADGNTLAVSGYLEDGAATGVLLPTSRDRPNMAADAGAVYMFTRQNGLWIEQAYIKAFNTQPDDHFGYSIALSADGSTLAVGAPGEDGATSGVYMPSESDIANTALDAGAVYVYVLENNNWVEQAYIKSFNNEAGDNFGTSIALSADGNTLAISAVSEDGAVTGVHAAQDSDTANTALNAGAVYLYTRNNTSWVEEAYIKAFNAQADDQFGQSIALSANGNVLSVGARYEDGGMNGVNLPVNSDTANAALDAGAVYVYIRENTGWVSDAYIKAFNNDAEDNFGYSISLSADGDTLAVGAPTEDGSVTGVYLPTESDISNRTKNSGAVYLYSRQNGNWFPDGYIKAFNTWAYDHFGIAVALSGDGNTLVISGDLQDGSSTGVFLPSDSATDDKNEIDGGAVYVYTRPNKNLQWGEDAYIKAFNSQRDDNYGTSIAVNADGTALAVGANLEDGSAVGVQLPGNSDIANLTLDAGAVYVY